MNFANTVNADLSDFYVVILNKYIQFYKKEIKNVNFFEGMTIEDLGSTSEQSELFNTEMEKWKNYNEEFKNIENINENNNNIKKYIITKNSKNFLTSDSLIAVLSEVYSLENEDEKSSYSITIKK
jgi:hypothetical protein